MTWHHHHDSDQRVVFCYDTPECLEDGVEGFDGLVCDVDGCPYHLIIGTIPRDLPAQMILAPADEVPEVPRHKRPLQVVD